MSMRRGTRERTTGLEFLGHSGRSRSHVRLDMFDSETPRERTVLPEVVTGQGNVSGVVSAATQHESARRGLGLAPGVMVARSDLLAAHLEVAAVGHGALVLAVLVEVAIVVPYVVDAGGLHHLDWKVRKANGACKHRCVTPFSIFLTWLSRTVRYQDATSTREMNMNR